MNLWYNMKALKERGGKMLEVLPQLDVRNRQNINLGEISKSSKPELERYAEFFRKNLSRIADYTAPNYLALEVLNDEGFLVSECMQDLPNFKVCHMSLIETLLENPAKLSKINLIHGVMPFDESYSLIQMLSKVPEVSGANTRVILGAYDNYEDEIHNHNRKVLNCFIDSLDFSGYHAADMDGTSVKMVYSTYQKNLRKRH